MLTLQALPMDVLFHIMQFLTTDERAVAAQTCRDMYAVSCCPALSRHIAFTQMVSAHIVFEDILPLCHLPGSGVGITSLDLRKCVRVIETGLCALLEAIGPSLECLRSGTIAISAVTLEALGRHCPRLHTLVAGERPESDLFDLSNVALVALVTACPRLRVLQFGSLRFTDSGLVELTTARPEIESLHMLAPLISSEGIVEMTKRLPKLMRFSLYVSVPLSAEALEAFSLNCTQLVFLKCRVRTKSMHMLQLPLLTVLDVSDSRWITNDAFDLLAESCPKLQTIRASGCLLLTGACLRPLAKLPALTHLDLQGSSLAAWPAFLVRAWIVRRLPLLEECVLRRGVVIVVRSKKRLQGRTAAKSGSSQSLLQKVGAMKDMLPFGAGIILYFAAASCMS